jgi:transcriptional regulator with XRE-family HTH domain
VTSVAEQFGHNLRDARRRLGMSQEHLSRPTGLHHTEIGLLERGLRIPLLTTIVRLSHGTGVDPGDLSKGIVWNAPRGSGDPGWFTVVGLCEAADLRRESGRSSS